MHDNKAIKVVILAGGMGTRLSEETELRPKPMVEIGGRPILWHIMKHYSFYGFNEFIIALGYKGDSIKRYFLEYCNLSGNITINLSKRDLTVQEKPCEEWLVHLIDTGQDTMTGGRIKRLAPLLLGNTFMLTYGDGVSDVNLLDLLLFHRASDRVATVTAVRPPARFGGLKFKDDLITEFTEKSQIGEGWINGGYMVFEPAIFDYIIGDECILESNTLERLASEAKLAGYRHNGFWQCMDTIRDKRTLDSLWLSGRAPWRLWT